jgi:hypothetical protein
MGWRGGGDGQEKGRAALSPAGLEGECRLRSGGEETIDARARLCVAGMRWSRRPIGGLGPKQT